MKHNTVVLCLGKPGANPANHDIRMITLRIYNSVDMLPHKQGEFNDSNTKGYFEADELEGILRGLESWIKYESDNHLIDEIRYEED